MPSDNLMYILDGANAPLVDGLDEALIGCTMPNCRAVYDAKKVANILSERQGMSYTQALDFISKGHLFVDAGGMTPVCVWPDDED